MIPTSARTVNACVTSTSVPGPRQAATICFSTTRRSGLRSDEATAITLSTGGEDLVHGNAVLAEGLADCPGLRAPTLVHIALGRAVDDLEPGRVAVAGRRAAVADQRNVTAVDERGPGIPLISDRPRRRGDQ